MIIDLTQQFFAIEGRPPANPDQSKVGIEAQLCYKQGQDIHSNLRKVYEIMLANRDNYFSNAAYSYSAFTDQQRTEFDNEIKNSLDYANIKISEFKEVVEAVKLRNTTEREHLKNIAICLYQMFKNISKLYREFFQFNQNRKRKIQSTIGLQAKKEFRSQQRKRETSHLERKISIVDQELERESKAIYMEKVSDSAQIAHTRKTLEQINQVLDLMSNKVLEQEILTSSFREIGEVGLFHIQKGNKNLVEANTISRDTGKYWTAYFLCLAFSLLFLDYLKS